MAVSQLKPNTSARRNMSINDFSEITKKPTKKSLLISKKQKSGRNNQGKITVRHRGGGAKRAIRIVDYKFTQIEGAKVVGIEYDPNRSANLALVQLPDGSQVYIIATSGLKVGKAIASSEKADIKGTVVNSIELNLGRGAQIARSAGTRAQIVAKEGKFVSVKLPSGEVRNIHQSAYATIGGVGNEAHQNIKLGSAGRRRHTGKRPTVRGKAMNPVDHAHGGGEGNTSIGLVSRGPQTPWGKTALGKKTRRRKYSNSMIIRSRKKGR